MNQVLANSVISYEWNEGSSSTQPMGTELRIQPCSGSWENCWWRKHSDEAERTRT